MEIESENRAPSNSPISIHEMYKNSYSKFQDEVSLKYGFVGLKLDKLSLTAEVNEEFGMDILNKCFLLYDYFGVVEPNLTSEGVLSSYKGQFFDDEKENWYIEYSPVISIKMNKRPLKIEFTPSKVSKKNFMIVFHQIFPYMKNIAISSFHLAYDFERDLSSLRVNWPKVMYRPIYKGMRLETMDFGAPKGNYHLTAYDKLRERVDTGDMAEIEIYMQYENLWRIEYKFYNEGNIKKELKNGLPFLSKIPVFIENFKGIEFQNLGVNEKIYLYALRNKPELFIDSDKRTVAKYKKLAESIAEVNLNVFFQNALDYTEIFNQDPCMINFFDFMKSMLAGDIPKL
ncbi:replication initiation protein [Carnobacterium maltaromaticum]|uniref:Replication initiation protein n=1 Tax=Carnobacterium maltaromaticum TaxID=2751 RepID=A0AAW9JWH0_CARML|nr:replication initiation protein [Carnobacterium maltaromaticum]MDZ5758959.1 replication initiation protein [Carnobacterium maltaromaticum]